MADKGLWQSIRSFVAERMPGSESTKSWSEPAVTPEGAALGFEWEATKTVSSAQHLENALLWPSASEAMEMGPLTQVSRERPQAGWTINGGKEGFDRDEAMDIAEDNAARHFIEPLVNASESYYARLSAMAENKSAAIDRDAGRDGFDVER